MNLRSNTTLVDYDEMVKRIAITMGVRAADIGVKRWQTNERGSAIHCLGKSPDSSFFAKILPLEQFPRCEPVTLPSEVLFNREQITRTAKEQIETEWHMANRLRKVKGTTVPKTVARSFPFNTIILETVAGEPLDRLIRQSRWRDPKGDIGAAALHQTGAWLRTAHDLFFQRELTLDIGKLCTTLKRYAWKSPSRHFSCICTAATILESAKKELGRNTVALPVSLTHGDPSLPNILWDRDSGQVAVVDFEHANYRVILHDLVALVYSIRVKLLNPVIPSGVVSRWEEAFWKGYGPLPLEIKIMVDRLASAWIFYWFLPILSVRARRRGLIRYLAVTVYQRCIIPRLTRTALNNYA